MLNYFFSGTPRCDHLQPLEDQTYTCRLVSCHGDYLRNVLQWADLHVGRPTEVEVMLDSGAFTAWNKGYHVAVDEVIHSYKAFMERAKGKFKDVWMINLDKIPGERGRSATADEIQDAIKVSDENFKILTDVFGPVVLPVFHQDEPLERLEELKQQSKYICVSPRNDMPERTRVEWANRAHGYCRGWKTHGLATTGVRMQRQSPWHSVDSATWIMAGAYGKVFTIKAGTLWPVGMSVDSPTVEKLGEHFDHMAPDEKAPILEAAARIGLDIETVRTHGRTRNVLNMRIICDWLNMQTRKELTHQEVLFEL